MKNQESNGQYSRIEQSTKITGDISSNADFRVDGTLEGSLKTKGKLIIGKEGKIIGEVSCSNADIEGMFSGQLVVLESLSLKTTSNMVGEVSTNKLIVETGAVFNATCSMGKEVKSLNKDPKAHEKTA
ncbi:MAG: bactofilin family protein [Flavobacteriaceae bacterium]